MFWCIIAYMQIFGGEIIRILVFSDTHGIIEGCIRTISNIGAVDMILHAGDTSGDAADLSYIFPDIPIRYVSGNCEISRADTNLEIVAENKKIFLTHGHLFNVKNELACTSLIKHSKAIGADIAVFGHTHKPLCQNLGDLILLNPGSAKYGNTYGVIEIENGRIGACVLDII